MRDKDAVLECPMSHGMGLDTVVPTWPPLTSDEVAGLLRHYPQVGAIICLMWHSPRPFSSACIVDTTSGRVFVKRLPRVIRTAHEWMEEHRFMAHLRRHGLAVGMVLRASDGSTAYVDGDWIYEVQRVGQGVDRYRDATSWTPFNNTADAAAAGQALAQLHLAARGYEAPARTIQLLASGFTLFNTTDPHQPLVRIQRSIQRCPALADYLAQRDWRQDVIRVLMPFHARLRPLLHGLTPLWTHNDWHASNLLWDTDGVSVRVATILDFGLADRTCAVYDLAIAIERNVITWLLPSHSVHFDQLDAMLDAYEAVLPLSALEWAVLPALLPLAHAEFALSELAYFHGVQKSAENAALAYDGYFLGHAAWFNSDAGYHLLRYLQQRGNRKNHR